jgi:RNA polymerase sigma-70 factor (ECF subfamily)
MYTKFETDDKQRNLDTQLVYRTLHEDKEAFGQLVSSYTPTFYALVKRMTPDRSPESIEDDLQEIFLRIYRALPTFREGSPFFSWAYTIAMNWIRSQRRKGRSHYSAPPIPYDEEVAILQGTHHTDIPEEAAIAAEAEHLVMQALDELKPAYREVFILRMMQGLSVSDTAKVMRIPEGTVKTYLHRGRNKLRDWLLKHHWNPED